MTLELYSFSAYNSLTIPQCLRYDEWLDADDGFIRRSGRVGGDDLRIGPLVALLAHGVILQNACSIS